MSVKILHDTNENMAVLYSSTTDWAFGPIFWADNEHDAQERAESFLRWLQCDPRDFEDNELERKFLEWHNQEDEQWKQEATETEYDLSDVEDSSEALTNQGLHERGPKVD